MCWSVCARERERESVCVCVSMSVFMRGVETLWGGQLGEWPLVAVAGGHTPFHPCTPPTSGSSSASAASVLLLLLLAYEVVVCWAVEVWGGRVGVGGATPIQATPTQARGQWRRCGGHRHFMMFIISHCDVLEKAPRGKRRLFHGLFLGLFQGFAIPAHTQAKIQNQPGNRIWLAFWPHFGGEIPFLFLPLQDSLSLLSHIQPRWT